jgi:GNAT superfamily N-acetyltransferase
VVQARASADYVNKVENPYSLGGSSLLMGATRVAPSKDTLWTASPQPGTMSDTEHNGLSYTTQPHVALDAVLATLSLGPVGISDGLGQVGVGLISQAFRCANDSTLLRPSRPLSWVDSVWVNKTFGGGAAVGGGVVDVRSTAVPPAFRGQGVAAVLVGALAAWARGAGLRVVAGRPARGRLPAGNELAG